MQLSPLEIRLGVVVFTDVRIFIVLKGVCLRNVTVWWWGQVEHFTHPGDTK